MRVRLDAEPSHIWLSIHDQDSQGRDMSWYYCLEHMKSEPEDGCPNSERMGPYASQGEADAALEHAAERNAAFDADED